MLDTNGSSSGEKATTAEALAHTIQEHQAQVSGVPNIGISNSLVWMIGQVADEFEPWGKRLKTRDGQLRAFIGTESIFAGALGSVCARNAGYSWFIQGGDRTRSVMKKILEQANFGRGWTDFIIKLTVDLSSQDTGAFFEIIRQGGGDSKPTSPILGIATLDAMRCWATGDPEKPVIYQDTKNKYHVMNWWQAVHLTEMPMPVDRPNGGTIQLCAESRLLIAAQIIKNAALYKYEKVSGRYMRGIHLVQGVTTQDIKDAIATKNVEADASGIMRYMLPLIVGTIDPQAKVDVKTLELATLPDNWDEAESFKQYVALIALAFGSDYQDFAPLPGGNLGTSAQSEVMHMKSRGKGPALFQKIIREAMNNHVMPDNAEFGFDEQDLEAEKATADVKLIRAESRAARIASGEISVPEARQEAVDDGDLALELFEAGGGLDATPNNRSNEQDRNATKPTDQIAPEGQQPPAGGTKALESLLVGVPYRQKQEIGEYLQSRLHRAFTTAADDLYAFGYMDTDERIKLSGVIGDVLREFEEEADSEVWDVVRRNVSGADLDTLISVAMKAHRRDQCMTKDCESPPEFEILWAEGKAHAWFCYDDLLAFDKENPYEINSIWRVSGGVASRRSPKKELRPAWRSRALQTA